MISDTFTMQTELVASEDMIHTYSVSRKFDNGFDRRILVCELYPTLSLDRISEFDLSTMHLLNHIRQLGDFSEVQIVNLFSFVCTNGKPTANKLKADDIENQAYLEDVLDEAKDDDTSIVIAWGSTWNQNETVQNLKQMVLNWIAEKGLEENTFHIVCDYLDTEKQCCTHPLYMGLRFSKEEWSLEKLDVQKMLEEMQPKEKVDEKKQPKKKGRGKKNVSEDNGQTGCTDGSEAGEK